MVTKCKNEELTEEMVQRVEQELDEEFKYLQPASTAERAAAGVIAAGAVAPCR